MLKERVTVISQIEHIIKGTLPVHRSYFMDEIASKKLQQVGVQLVKRNN